jgi:hypothetical protein
MQAEIDRNREATAKGDMATVTLEARIRALEISNEVMFRLLMERLGITEDELRQEIEKY